MNKRGPPHGGPTFPQHVIGQSASASTCRGVKYVVDGVELVSLHGSAQPAAAKSSNRSLPKVYRRRGRQPDPAAPAGANMTRQRGRVAGLARHRRRKRGAPAGLARRWRRSWRSFSGGWCSDGGAGEKTRAKAQGSARAHGRLRNRIAGMRQNVPPRAPQEPVQGMLGIEHMPA